MALSKSVTPALPVIALLAAAGCTSGGGSTADPVSPSASPPARPSTRPARAPDSSTLTFEVRGSGRAHTIIFGNGKGGQNTLRGVRLPWTRKVAFGGADMEMLAETNSVQLTVLRFDAGWIECRIHRAGRVAAKERAQGGRSAQAHCNL